MQALLRQSLRSEQIAGDPCSPQLKKPRPGRPAVPTCPPGGSTEPGPSGSSKPSPGGPGCAGTTGSGARHGALTANTGV